ncbi:hypothetical protein T12_13463 [Trichinella patagoniensis]|uniref:Uncharacterized protein n=1 Tax=Trichinella patagoniensis TaxID=990121 RepID=A0A0V1A9Z2_9BILA|nr:hypothetical protein T12_13463 [Trichinella patagoniensis]
MSIRLHWSNKSDFWRILFMFAFIDMFIDSIDYALQGETMGMHKVRIVSLSPKSASKQDGIVEVPE